MHSRKLNRARCLTIAVTMIAAAHGCGIAAADGTASDVAADSTTTTRAHADSLRADSIDRARQDSINRTLPGYIVDSILPLAEEIRRFKTAVGGSPVTAFSGGSDSREGLVRRFVSSVAARDSQDMQRMLVSAREFIDLVYPSSPFAGPPYDEAPGRVWMMIANPSTTGLTRLLRRVGGLAVTYMAHTCAPAPDTQGENRIWVNCTVQIAGADGKAERHRLFGSIVERAGQFKFMSYSNEM